MSASNHPSRLLLFSPESDSGLEAVLASHFPECQIQAQRFSLQAWLKLCHQPKLVGILVDADSLSLGDLRALAAGTAATTPSPWLLFLVGDRGIAGFESLLENSSTTILPKPWTPAGLRQALAGFTSPPPPSSTTQDAFLEGLVEGLRDPLTSISGYLQLLEHQEDNRIRPLVTPALEAASQIASQLEYLQLATTQAHSHIAPTNLTDLVEELAKACIEENMLVEVEATQSLVVDADSNYLRAAMRTARLLLQRFGPGGPFMLQCHQDRHGILLSWSMEPPTELSPPSLPPPPYLGELFRRLAQRVPADAFLQQLEGTIPQRVGLLWRQEQMAPKSSS